MRPLASLLWLLILLITPLLSDCHHFLFCCPEMFPCFTNWAVVDLDQSVTDVGCSRDARQIGFLEVGQLTTWQLVMTGQWLLWEFRIRSQVAVDPDSPGQYLTHVMPSAAAFQLKTFTHIIANLVVLVIFLFPDEFQVLKVSNEGHSREKFSFDQMLHWYR